MTQVRGTIPQLSDNERKSLVQQLRLRPRKRKRAAPSRDPKVLSESFTAPTFPRGDRTRGQISRRKARGG